MRRGALGVARELLPVATQARLTTKGVAGTTGLMGCCSRQKGTLTLVSLHNAQVFRLLLKTSVERDSNEFSLFLAGFAVWRSRMCLLKAKVSSCA